MKRLLCAILIIALILCGTSFAIAEEPETIQVAFMLTMNAAEERKLVEQAINDELDKANLGVHIELVGIDFASWSSQITLMLADGSLDLFNCCFMPSVSVLADQGSIAPLNDLLEQYGQGILETLGDYINCAKIGDTIYGTPKIDAFSRAKMYFMNKEIADELGIDPESVTDLASLTEVLKAVKEARPDLIMIACNNGGDYYRDYTDADLLGTEKPLGVLLLEDGCEDTTVVNYYESERFKQDMAFAKQWSELGFFMKDPLNAQDGAFAYVTNGQAFGCFGAYCSEDVGLNIQQKGTGVPLYCCQITDYAWATTSNVTAMTWCVPALSRHQEAAAKFLNEMYTNPVISNLVCNGIDGRHYIVTDEGNIVFAEGLDAMNTGWPSGMGTFWPNITISLPWAPDPTDVYEGWLATNDTCMKSPALGFSFDSSNVSDEISACLSVLDQYVNALMLNIADTDALYEKFIAALKDAGIDDVIAEKQAQLDAWKAAK